MIRINIVFWLIVILIAFGIWLLFWPVFGNIGKKVKDEAKAIKTEIKDEWEENEK